MIYTTELVRHFTVVYGIMFVCIVDLIIQMISRKYLTSWVFVTDGTIQVVLHLFIFDDTRNEIKRLFVKWSNYCGCCSCCCCCSCLNQFEKK